MKTIELSQGRKTIVDDDDFEKFGKLRWSYSQNGSVGYAVSENKDGKKIYLHRMIMGASGAQMVDHIDNDGLNNQKINLRFCSRSQNLFNQRKPNRKNCVSRFKGVTRNRGMNSSWYVRLAVNGKNLFLGSFKTEIDAAKAYDKKVKEVRGEFAHLNYA